MTAVVNIKDLSIDDLGEYMIEKGYPKYRAAQVFEWIYKDIESFSDITNLPKDLISILKDEFYINRAEIERKQISKIDETIKYLLKFKDGNAVECVLMHYEYGNTICISTQAGCRMNCSFCASTIGGLNRNLSSGEMLEEVMCVSRDINGRISNIVLMGSGEPFDNYDQVVKFIRTINHNKGLNIGTRHITISSCGIVPKIYDFINEKLQCTLAISLHAVNNETRDDIMPINKKYPIEQLIDACKEYIKKTNRRVTFEYALIKGVNDSVENAVKLSNLLKDMLCHVNLIPVNNVEEKGYLKSDMGAINKFRQVLEKSGIETTIRRELGSDIDAACGQLRRKYIEDSNKSQ